MLPVYSITGIKGWQVFQSYQDCNSSLKSCFCDIRLFFWAILLHPKIPPYSLFFLFLDY